MSEIIVKVEKNGHANLDSFPYRYGFSGSKDFNLKLNYELKITPAGKRRINVKKAKFKNPETGNIEIGNFVLERNIVVTVIRHDIKTEATISKVISVLRKHKYITVDDLINYFHPLYLNGEIETHEDLRQYLKDYMSSDSPERISEMEATIALTVQELEKEKAEHNLTKEKLEKSEQRNKNLEERLKQFQPIADSRNEEVKKEGTNQRSKEFPDVDWNKNTVTSAIFSDWCVIGDFLCVYLFDRDKPIRLKNTFIYDYPEALRVVKTITTGYVIDYVTKGSETFPTDEWFSKIIKVENPMSDVYSNEEWKEIEDILDEPMPDFPERGIITLGRDGSKHVVVNDSKNPYCIFRARNNHSDNNFYFEKYAQLLREQPFTSGSTFTIQGVYLAPAPLFVEYFGHIWNKPMLGLETDKGWFVDTTVKEHGGTYWKENETYHNCRVSMTKEKDKPYWLQKKADVDNIPF